jgi:hypothetical protein
MIVTEVGVSAVPAAGTQDIRLTAASVTATPFAAVSAPLIPDIKRAISLWSVPEAEGVAREALGMDSCEAVRRLLLLKRPSPEPRKQP